MLLLSRDREKSGKKEDSEHEKFFKLHHGNRSGLLKNDFLLTVEEIYGSKLFFIADVG